MSKHDCISLEVETEVDLGVQRGPANHSAGQRDHSESQRQ